MTTAEIEDGQQAIKDDADLLRFATAGSVDDGKSTLIGRLLLDSKSIFEDQLDAVERQQADELVHLRWTPRSDHATPRSDGAIP